MLKQLTKKININRLLHRFARTTLLVVGDVMIDEFIWGRVSRISPEAPVPVVAVTSDTLLLGGAANVVNNVHSLGGRVLLTGVIGSDRMGEKMKELLAEKGIDLEGIAVEPERPTTVKTRIIAHNQQVVRFDRESLEPIHRQSQQKLLTYIDSCWDKVDGIIISDYGKGVITPGLMGFIMDKRKADDKLVAVDPKMNNFELYRGVTVLTPNSKEAEVAAGRQIRDEDSLKEVGRNLLERFASQAVLITRGEEGMILFERTGKITKVPTVAKEVYDVTGAGDTVIGTLTLALAAGSDFAQAAVLANYAAGIVVGKVGTAIVTPEELRKAIAEHAHP
ncbi:MAG: D-glycero-beta-D-manno-heptose-7-phosphate kinase [Deltaproteobacteria bacterium]|nr:MAG: D-glycero-beta-D-manno-heptose-7-phosphate kinase [Deltaproteobacteria bacterium]